MFARRIKYGDRLEVWTRHKFNHKANQIIGKRFLQLIEYLSIPTERERKPVKWTFSFSHHSDTIKRGTSTGGTSAITKSDVLAVMDDPSVPGIDA